MRDLLQPNLTGESISASRGWVTFQSESIKYMQSTASNVNGLANKNKVILEGQVRQNGERRQRMHQLDQQLLRLKADQQQRLQQQRLLQIQNHRKKHFKNNLSFFSDLEGLKRQQDAVRSKFVQSLYMQGLQDKERQQRLRLEMQVKRKSQEREAALQVQSQIRQKQMQRVQESRARDRQRQQLQRQVMAQRQMQYFRLAQLNKKKVNHYNFLKLQAKAKDQKSCEDQPSNSNLLDLGLRVQEDRKRQLDIVDRQLEKWLGNKDRSSSSRQSSQERVELVHPMQQNREESHEVGRRLSEALQHRYKMMGWC